MENVNNSWSKSEIIKLFKVVEMCKGKNTPLLFAFKEFAENFKRKQFSVRNFYYNQLRIFENNQELCEKFGINLEIHKKNLQKFFSKEEEENCKQKIQDLIRQGYSIRRACLEVAGGDVKQMLRLQNKYYASNKVVRKDNISIMPIKKVCLSDEEINSLFLGLVKLVKKSAEETAGQSFVKEFQTANHNLRKSIKELAEKEREVKLLRKKFEMLSNEKSKLKEEIKSLRSQNVELLKADYYPAKLDSLKNYLNKIGKSQPKFN